MLMPPYSFAKPAFAGKDTLDMGEGARAEEPEGVGPSVAIVDAKERGGQGGEHLRLVLHDYVGLHGGHGELTGHVRDCGHNSIYQSMPSAVDAPGGQCPQDLATALSIILTTTSKSCVDPD
jgi:hypothetical protein